MNKPLLTIIVPVYNREKYIEDCVKSILFQTYENFVLLIVDDGSTDNSLQVINGFDDPRIIVKSLSHQGCWPAKNEAVRSVDTDFLMFVDSDDVILSNYVSRMMKHVASNSGYDYYYPLRLTIAYSNLKDTGRVWRYLDNAGPSEIIKLFFQYAIAGVPHPASVIKTDLFLKTGLFKDDLKNYGDAVYIIQNCSRIKFKSVDENGYINRQHDEQTNKDKTHAVKAIAYLADWFFKSKLPDEFIPGYKKMKDIEKYSFVLRTISSFIKRFPGYESEFTAYAEYWVNLTRN